MSWGVLLCIFALHGTNFSNPIQTLLSGIPQVDSIARDTVAAPIRFRRPDGSTFVDGIRYSNVKWLLERSLDCTGTNGVSMSGNETVVSM